MEKKADDARAEKLKMDLEKARESIEKTAGGAAAGAAVPAAPATSEPAEPAAPAKDEAQAGRQGQEGRGQDRGQAGRDAAQAQARRPRRRRTCPATPPLPRPKSPPSRQRRPRPRRLSSGHHCRFRSSRPRGPERFRRRRSAPRQPATRQLDHAGRSPEDPATVREICDTPLSASAPTESWRSCEHAR